MEKIKDNTYESIVYISHPYGGEKINEDETAVIINQLQEKYPNYLFLSPIHAFSYAYHLIDYNVGINMCLWLLEKADEMWVFGDWKNSKGCNMEVEYCEEFNIPYCLMNAEDIKFED